jgi:AraC-like DNA-binding protein
MNHPIAPGGTIEYVLKRGLEILDSLLGDPGKRIERRIASRSGEAVGNAVHNLAAEVGLSRPVLADRFRRYLGEPPMAYLTRWRLQLGAQHLTTSARSVAEIADAVG